MKAIAINGSPRRNRNTATLLQKSLDGAKSIGAETELVHLYSLQFKGCASCFACKLKNSKFVGHCAMKDDLTEYLEKILNCDVLLLGSPVYYGNLTGEMICLLERLLFSNASYSADNRSIFKGKIASGFVGTMNAQEETVKQYNYEAVFQQYSNL